MSARVIIGIIAIACISVCGPISTFTSSEMVDQVNARLPKSEQFEGLGWYTEKTLRLHREYRRLYPEGRLLFKLRVLTALMFACLLISAWAFGVFAKFAWNPVVR